MLFENPTRAWLAVGDDRVGRKDGARDRPESLYGLLTPLKLNIIERHSFSSSMRLAFSIGRHFRERERVVAEGRCAKLGALHWREREIVFDTGKALVTG